MRLPDARKAASRVINRPTGMTTASLMSRQSLEDAVGGRVVLVTGASSGIGEASAVRIGEAGATVVLVARTREKLEELASRIGPNAHVAACDLSDIEDLERMGSEVLDRHGRVDVLVNNAGRSIRRSVARSYERFHDYERTMQLNYFAAVRLVLAFLPAMREARDGHVVNVSTAGVQTRVPRFSGYIASKAALDAFSECVAAEVARDGVRFTTIHMPLVRTPMIEPTPAYRQVPSMSAEEAADWICRAIVHRPRRVGTPYSEAAGVLNAVSPGVFDRVRSASFRLFPDTRAARGKEPR